jgi:hypothetical protein
MMTSPHTIRRYLPGDYNEIAAWYHARNLEAPRPQSLPRVGYIYPERAAGFLIQTDVDTALIEGLIANPACLVARRDEALDLIVLQLTETANTLGFNFVTGFTKFPVVQKRALDHEFKDMGQYQLMVKEIK